MGGGVRGARKSVQWTDVSPEPRAPGRRPAVSTKNRDRLLATDVARKVLAAVLAHREVAPLLLDEHFPVDGTLVKAWAWVSNRWRHRGSPSMNSFQPKPKAAPPGGDRPDDPPSPPPTAAADAAAVPAADAAAAAAVPAAAANANADAETCPETAPMTTEKPKDRNTEVDFRGQKRSNATHAPVTDP